MNSHIQIPKCVLREFALNNNGFFKYSVNSKKITNGFPKTTFTEENYYSDTMEKLLNKHIESPLKKLLVFAKDLSNEPLSVNLDSEIQEIALTYAKSLVARNPLLCKSAMEHSIFGQFLSKRNQHDYCVSSAMSNIKMVELFDKFDLSFIINRTNTPFVLATRGLYEFTMNGILCMVSPLNPNCGLFFIEKGKKIHNNIDIETEIMIIPQDFDNVVMQMNSFAMMRQIQDGFGYIICDCRAVLDSLVL